MKVVLLAGGFGTRITEESEFKPKPMIEIGGMPMLWHIMKYYSFYGHTEFIICAGYKQHKIKKWLANYFLYTCDVTFDFTNENRINIHNQYTEPWKVTVIDTGLETLTGGRLKRVGKYIGDAPFLMTYGDGVSNIDINKLVEFHNAHGKLVTLSAVKPEGRFGMMEINGDRVISFREKHKDDVGWINGGFMVLDPDALDYIKTDVMFEQEPMEQLANDGQLMCYKHDGFWQCMDTLRDKQKLEGMWASQNAPWKVW
ncbi:MAG: glucose-1-phosphate cytidylyltransferase [Clostridium sp.]|nr:glucose-1-phosphate cytidylyltransferase [Clostridium sp.]